MTAPVFLVEPGRLDAVAPGDVVRLDGAEGRHAGVVQRRTAGERVDVVDTCGVRLVGVVASVTHEGVDVQAQDVVREPAPPVRLVLVQALAKGDRDELAIEAATEVGADAVVPWQAERSIVVWRGERAAKSRARWLGTVRTAAKQSRRAWVPDVAHALDSRHLAARTREVVEAGGAVLVLHEDATEPLAGTALPDAGDVLVVVGPEGGIGDDELARLTDAGARPVRLGPHVLRTSTAGPVALALLATRLGRWS
ncbi:16S rRNA (uracil(1498)-N(3))-methyltransferase [Cellulomonas persica]|uniref:Ribosomal RNA small subunit methyltransferase E n=1 Tax=Cellulomonas persica TaxID=76861 RepID=A0A510UWE3_9CELL|nr:16S rRNA (uracil(1498)-N(3))-methyltransferase [Cellulomonas persica]GEK17821.1 ribosomal RNA small subunit methyltransferase E [Cellulomonas persica]